MRLHGPRYRLAVLTITTTSSALAMSGPDGNEIARRAHDAYVRSRTYQVVYQTRLSGNIGSLSLRISIKTVPGRKFRFDMSPTGPGTGLLARQANLMRMQIADDGTKGYGYIVPLKEFRTGPHEPSYRAITFSYGIFLGEDLDTSRVSYRCRGLVSLAGRPTYVIEPDRAEKSGGSLLIYVDRETYRIRGTKGDFPFNGQHASASSMVVRDEVNAPLPDSTFRLSPPKGIRVGSASH